MNVRVRMFERNCVLPLVHSRLHINRYAYVKLLHRGRITYICDYCPCVGWSRYPFIVCCVAPFSLWFIHIYCTALGTSLDLCWICCVGTSLRSLLFCSYIYFALRDTHTYMMRRGTIAYIYDRHPFTAMLYRGMIHIRWATFTSSQQCSRGRLSLSVYAYVAESLL